MAKGEIHVQAETNGRPLTLDPIRTKAVSIAAREVAKNSTILCGFRQNWVEGETEAGVPFALDVGAGVGSPWLTFFYRDREYCMHVEDIARGLVGFADEEPA